MAKKKTDTEAADVGFEKALERLEAIVEELEKGELELDRSLSLFEEGVGLSRICMKKLDEAQSRVEMLLADPEGGVRSVRFENGDEGEASEST